MVYLLILCSGTTLVLNILDASIILRLNNKMKEAPIATIFDSKRTYKLTLILMYMVVFLYIILTDGNINRTATATNYALYMIMINLIVNICLHTFTKTDISATRFRLNGYVFPLDQLSIVETERLKNGKVRIIGVAPVKYFKKQYQVNVSFYMEENVALSHQLLKTKLNSNEEL